MSQLSRTNRGGSVRRLLTAALLSATVLISLPASPVGADSAGYALQFDGANDFVELPYTLNILGAGWETTKSVSLWVKPLGTAAVCEYNTIGFCDSILGDRPRWWGIARGVLNGQDRLWVWNYDNSPGSPADILSVDYTPGEWIHVSLVHGGGVLLAYRNGIQVGGTPSGATIQPSTGALPRLQLGGVINNASRNWTFEGILDEVSLWNVVRSQTEIQADMFRILAGTESGLRAYYGMTDGAGSVLSDDGPGGWDGTLRDGTATVPPNGAPPLWVLSDAFGSPGSTPTVVPPTSTATATGMVPSETPTATGVVASETPPPSTATATVAPGGFPAAGVLDSFNRANGGIGSAWSGSVGSYAIAGNQLDVTANGSVFWNATSFGLEQEAYVTVATADPGAGAISLILKSQSSTSAGSGVLRVLYNPAGGLVQVSTYSVAQGWVQRGSNLAMTLSSGDQLGARVRADGMVEVFKNGSLMGVRDASAWTHIGAGGYVGLWLSSATNVFLDDFGGG